MDLNQRMVDIYKQRTAASNIKMSKRPRMNSKDSNSPSVVTKSAQGDERRKFEDVMESMDYLPLATFEELHGCEAARDQILRIVERFQRFLKSKAKKSGWPVLICGSRGLGKTSIVEAAANASDLEMVLVPMKTLVEQTRNEFKTSLNLFLKYSISRQPAIVLIDDLEQLNDKEDYRHLLRGFVKQLLDASNQLLVFCTTSSVLDSVSEIDFLFTIHLKRPNVDARFKILQSICENNQNLFRLPTKALQGLAVETPSFTALDLKKMLDIAETESGGTPTIEHCNKAVDVIKLSFRRGTHLIGEKPKVTWDDIGGLFEVRLAFSDILKQIKKGDINCKFAGIALYGPPGCGKTMVAQAMANEAGLNFISIKPAELVNKFLGETERNIRRVFSEAQEHEPCMIYFDEFDGLCGTRGHKDTVTSAIQTLLSEMDGFVSRGKSIILAATNRLEDIDPAMKRPGRLSKHIYVGPPDEAARKAILQVIFRKSSLKLHKELELDFLTEKTENFTGAELEFLVSEAESRAMSELDANRVNDLRADGDELTLGLDHFQYAMSKVLSSNKELAKKSNNCLRRIKSEAL